MQCQQIVQQAGKSSLSIGFAPPMGNARTDCLDASSFEWVDLQVWQMMIARNEFFKKEDLTLQ
ncbi:hypothetical protein D3C80_2185020 [compost metagenome]